LPHRGEGALAGKRSSTDSHGNRISITARIAAIIEAPEEMIRVRRIALSICFSLPRSRSSLRREAYVAEVDLVQGKIVTIG
jgi:hypothetical protein